MELPGEDENVRVGTLGSELTFAGQATRALREQMTAPSELSYFPTMDGVAEAILEGTIDIGVLTSETSNTACTDTFARILDGEPLFVVDEVIVPYRCALLGQPGSSISELRHVGGHGSIRQCQAFIRSNLAHADVRMHRENSVVAAREVLDGDGTTAVIGTLAVAASLGLEVLAADIDNGSSGGWWALTSVPRYAPDSDVIALRAHRQGELEVLLKRCFTAGLAIRTVTNAPSGELFKYRYLLTATTTDGRPVPEHLIDELRPNLVGVFSSTTAS